MVASELASIPRILVEKERIFIYCAGGPSLPQSHQRRIVATLFTQENKENSLITGEDLHDEEESERAPAQRISLSRF